MGQSEPQSHGPPVQPPPSGGQVLQPIQTQNRPPPNPPVSAVASAGGAKLAPSPGPAVPATAGQTTVGQGTGPGPPAQTSTAALQMVNGQLVVQAQLQQVQTPNGLITVAVIPQGLMSAGQLQMLQAAAPAAIQV